MTFRSQTSTRTEKANGASGLGAKSVRVNDANILLLLTNAKHIEKIKQSCTTMEEPAS
jgi:hypothetical protein